MSEFDEFDHYRLSDDDFNKSSGQNIPKARKSDGFEDVFSDYKPKNVRANQSNNQPTQQKSERKFFDDNLLKKRSDPDAYSESARQNQHRANNFPVNDFSGNNAKRRSDMEFEDFSSETSNSGSFYLANYSSENGAYRQPQGGNREVYPNSNDTRNRNPYDDDYEDYGNGRKPPKGKKKKKNIAVKIIVIVLVAILALSGAAYAVFHGVFNSLNQGTTIDENDVGFSDVIAEKYGNQNIINIALFGVDTREEDSFEGRSDSIMIVSVNRKTSEIKLISILRDSYVKIEGHGSQKITHAYMYGGAQLAVKTINQNFDMNITDYATINFLKMGDVIDAFGGLDIEINDMEMDMINGLGNSEGRKVELVTKTGLVHLNGDQAVSYARIRKDGDDKRAERQRLVLNKLLEKAKKISVTKYPSLVKSMMKMVETSMSSSEILSLAPLALKNIEIVQTVVPDDNLDKPKGGNIGGNWVWKYDLKKASDRMHKFIYEDPSDDNTVAEEPKTTAKAEAKTTTKSSKTTKKN